MVQNYMASTQPIRWTSSRWILYSHIWCTCANWQVWPNHKTVTWNLLLCSFDHFNTRCYHSYQRWRWVHKESHTYQDLYPKTISWHKLSNLLFSASLAASFAVCFKSGTSETEQTHKTCICCVSIVCCAVTCTTYDFMMDCAVHSSCTLDVPSPHCTMHIYLSIYIC